MKSVLGNVDLDDGVLDAICQVCPKARQTKFPFPVSSIKSTEPFLLLHLDVWGPYENKTYTSCNQFLTIVDDYTRFTWVHLLKSRSEVSGIFRHFYAYVETQFCTKIRGVSDNAKELIEGDLKEFCLEKRIVQQSSCPHTPQQNGVVERKHRHLLEVARALQFQSNLPIRFWGDCVMTTTYLINRTPLKSINFLTPYYKLYKTELDLSHLKVFGCLCFVTTVASQRGKFQPRALPCVFYWVL